MKKLLVSSTYTIKLSEEVFARIIHKDHESEKPSLYLLLNRIDGITDVDYSGHYGPVIIITLDAEYDTPITWLSIRNIITKYEMGQWAM